MMARQMRPAGKDPTALFDRAVAAFEGGDIKAAAKDAKRLIKLAPQSPEVWQLQAMVMLSSDRPKEALKSARRGLKLAPGQPALSDILGTALMHMEQFEDAAAAYRQALKQMPDNPGLLNNLGNALHHSGADEEAVAAYADSLRLRPGHADTAFNQGNALGSLRRYSDAETAFRTALATTPDDPDILLNLGETLVQLRRLDDALDIFQRLDGMGVHTSGLFNNMGSALMGLCRIQEAFETLDRGAEIGRDDPLYMAKLSVFLFLQNRWKEGWDAFEARFAVGTIVPRPFQPPWWQGETLAGKSILVWAEQGLGDEIMGASMLPDLVDAGAEVTFECDPRLAPGVARAFPEVQVFPRTDPPAEGIRHRRFDLQSPLLSLARWLRPDEASYPAESVFLSADPARIAELRGRYHDGSDDPLIGITWTSANPNIGDTKSMPLARLTPILKTPGVRFVDLQYGDTAAERRAVEAETGCALLHDDAIDPMVDFEGHLAQVAAMDLIISISNTTVHAAGAMGIPVWVMIRQVPDRRWLLDREDSPWYGSVRLFRQTVPDDWTDVIERVGDALSDYLADFPR